FSATASDSDGFISRVEFFADSLKLGEATNSPYTLVWSNAPRGAFSLMARASDNWRGSNDSAVVAITISNSPPSVVLTNPVAGATFFEGTNITLSARASDADGQISRVEFFAGTNSLGPVTNSPYTLVRSEERRVGKECRA